LTSPIPSPRNVRSPFRSQHTPPETDRDIGRNSTTAYPLHGVDTYWGQFDQVSKYNVSLNYFEKLWAAWYAYMQNDVLATGIMSFVMHETVYFGRSLPWIIIDLIPYFRKWKIQDVCYCIGGLGLEDGTY
jgi:hypothetical protein